MKNVEIDPDIKKEYENQRKYLENSQDSLKKRLAREQDAHKQDNMNIMKENIKLIKMISELRREVKQLASQEKNTRTQAKMVANQSQMMNESKGDMDSGYQGMTEEQQMQQSDL